MGNDPVAEEGRSASAGAVDQLVGHHHVEGFDVLAQAADSAHGEDELDAELLEGVDVGPRGNLRREDAMTHAMSRQEGNSLARQRADYEIVARQPEGCVDAQLFDV